LRATVELAARLALTLNEAAAPRVRSGVGVIVA
jgi:hypothetical protein